MRLPLIFISFGIEKGKMYKHFGGRSNFVTTSGKRWGNSVVYGALFLCKDFDFYSRILDAYMVCSMSTMCKNHICDIHHRKETSITPIKFESLDDLSRLKYREGQPIKALTYMGNINHPKINQRLNKTVSYRIIDGIDAENFKKLYREVQGE